MVGAMVFFSRSNPATELFDFLFLEASSSSFSGLSIMKETVRKNRSAIEKPPVCQ